MSTRTSQPPYRVTNPATGEVLEEFPTATDADIEHAVAASATAQREWARRPLGERAEVLKRVDPLLAERAEQLAGVITQEMGKKLAASLGELTFCQDIFDYYAQEGPALLADQELPAPGGGRATIQHVPLGPVLGIMPWNFPWYQAARFIAPNLLAGNSVILKHSEQCPRSATAIADVLAEAGVPDGVFTNVFATYEQVAAVIADPRVHGVSFTGSERAGSRIAEQAGRHLKKVVLELGGSDPYIVLDAADPAAAAAGAWRVRMGNNGQACNSNKRIIVLADIYDEFVAGLTAVAKGLTPGDPTVREKGTYPPMASAAAVDTIAAQVDDAVAKGATLHTGGRVVDGPGAYYQPAVLTGVQPGMRAFDEELFGPVAVVYRVESDDEAVRLANASGYGLGAAVFSTDPERAAAVADALEVGMTHVNTPAVTAASLPFGGVKRSGFGRELGPLGVHEFVNRRLFYRTDGG